MAQKMMNPAGDNGGAARAWKNSSETPRSLLKIPGKSKPAVAAPMARKSAAKAEGRS